MISQVSFIRRLRMLRRKYMLRRSSKSYQTFARRDQKTSRFLSQMNIIQNLFLKINKQKLTEHTSTSLRACLRSIYVFNAAFIYLSQTTYNQILTALQSSAYLRRVYGLTYFIKVDGEIEMYFKFLI